MWEFEKTRANTKARNLYHSNDYTVLTSITIQYVTKNSSYYMPHVRTTLYNFSELNRFLRRKTYTTDKQRKQTYEFTEFGKQVNDWLRLTNKCLNVSRNSKNRKSVYLTLKWISISLRNLRILLQIYYSAKSVDRRKSSWFQYYLITIQRSDKG